MKSESNEHKFEKNGPTPAQGCTRRVRRRRAGSTTACIATIDQTHGLLRSANVGDSGFMIVRGDPGNRDVCHRSPHQEHEFGRPFQLGHHANSDTPEDAMLTAFPLEPGDIVVMGSDGLWDNLSEIEILDVIESVFQGSSASAGLGAESQGVMNKASRELVSAAYTASMDKRRTTPPPRGDRVVRHGVLWWQKGRHHRGSSQRRMMNRAGSIRYRINNLLTCPNRLVPT